MTSNSASMGTTSPMPQDAEKCKAPVQGGSAWVDANLGSAGTG